MDKVELGRRVARARDESGLTQDALGRRVNLDRSAVSRLEKGERKLSVPELVAIAGALGRPLADFVAAPVPAAVGRRSDESHGPDPSRAVDRELEPFAADLRLLAEMSLVEPVDRSPEAGTPRTHEAAEEMARRSRDRLGLGHDPIADLGATCERLGLHTYSAPLGVDGPDGGCVAVTPRARTVGAAVVNGQAPAGRRRMTLAHELGHWLSGDAYDSTSSAESQDRERMLNSFAIHLLAPRQGVDAAWRERTAGTTHDRALRVAAMFRLSWSATLNQLRNIRSISSSEHADLRMTEPRRGDYVRLGLSWAEELGSPYLSPRVAAACVDGYASHRLTAARALEILRGTVSGDELPPPDPLTLDDLRRSFAGHGG